MNIQYVPTHLIHHIWPNVEGYLRNALEQAGADEYNVDQLKVMVVQGTQDLYVAVDENNDVHGAGTVSFVNYPNYRVAFVTAIGGRLFTSKETWEQFTALLKIKGATRVQGAARESIARLWRRYGFRERSITVEVTL